jgi:hypothetical protein
MAPQYQALSHLTITEHYAGSPRRMAFSITPACRHPLHAGGGAQQVDEPVADNGKPRGLPTAGSRSSSTSRRARRAASGQLASNRARTPHGGERAMCAAAQEAEREVASIHERQS